MVIKEVFVDLDDVINEIISSESVDEYTIVGDYEDSRIVLKRLLGEEGKLPYFLEMEDPAFDFYTKEYIISASANNDDLFCEKAFNGGSYSYLIDGFIFVLPSCSDEFKDYIKNIDEDIVCFMVEYPSDNCLDHEEKVLNETDNIKHNVELIECNNGDTVGYIVKINGEDDDDIEWYLDLKDMISEILGFSF